MGEVPKLTVEGHVFQIDPKTKKQWLPLSAKAVHVSFYHDSSNQLYRIVSVHENKVLINSSLTSASKFTKTSSKFGQWMDHAASTVYGLGFEQEGDLDKFAEMFMSSLSLVGNEKPRQLEGSVQEKIKGFQRNNSNDVINNNVITNNSSELHHKNGVSHNHNNHPASNPIPTATKPSSKTPTPPSTSRSSKLPMGVGGADDDAACGDAKCAGVIMGLMDENEKMKKELAESVCKAAKWEGEVAKLRSENSRLVTSNEESRRSVDGWKERVDEYRVEIAAHRAKVSEMDNMEVQMTEKTERLKVLEKINEDARLELAQLHEVAKECRVAQAVNKSLSARLKEVEEEKRVLEGEVREARVRGVDGGGVGGRGVGRGDAKELVQLQEKISHKINELYEMNDQLAERLQFYV